MNPSSWCTYTSLGGVVPPPLPSLDIYIYAVPNWSNLFDNTFCDYKVQPVKYLSFVNLYDQPVVTTRPNATQNLVGGKPSCSGPESSPTYFIYYLKLLKLVNWYTKLVYLKTFKFGKDLNYFDGLVTFSNFLGHTKEGDLIQQLSCHFANALSSSVTQKEGRQRSLGSRGRFWFIFSLCFLLFFWFLVPNIPKPQA